MAKKKTTEDLYDPNDHVLDYMKSSEWKAGMPDGSKEDEVPPGYKYRRGGKYNAASGQGGAGTMYEDHQTGEGNKKLRIYDFDDTLAITRGANILIKHADGSIEELDPSEYASYQTQTGDKFDFTQFDKVIQNATPIKHIVDLLRADVQNVTNKVTILTARMLAYPVRRYLKTELGLNVYVVAVGSSDPKEKADWIENQISKGYDDIKFIDDSEKNIAAVEALKVKYPDIKLEVNHPDDLKEMMGTMNNQEKAKHAKNLKRLKKDTAKQGDQYMKVPDYLKGTLTRKLYEMEDQELKYWETQADLVKKLDSPDAEETYLRLKQELTGDKLEALEYFYHVYFKEDSPENLKESKTFSKTWWTSHLKEPTGS
ncbi:MAG: hypothetical protein H8E55_31755 [Pelagibacterales bacterium]|nr:hypothetical protein [Pelagibacterales bacterium]